MVPRAGTPGWRMFVIGGAIDVQSTEAVREVVELKEVPNGGDDKMEVLKMQDMYQARAAFGVAIYPNFT